MGACSGKSASLREAEEKKRQKDAAVERASSLGITAQFLRNAYGASLEEDVLDTLRAEIKRREEMPPMTITCLLPEEGQKRQITVWGYETLGFSMSRELRSFSVEKVSFANLPVEDLETMRWEELDIETGAVVSAFGVQWVADTLVAAMAAANPHVIALKFEEGITRSAHPTVLRAVNFSHLGIRTLPEMIGGLKISGDLLLYGNQLTSLPDSMGSMQVGGSLYLDGNRLTALPESMGSIKVGEDLRLDNNQLASLPESMGSIQVGGKLRLSYNQLASLPASMGSMQVGGGLHLEANRLTALPESIGSIKVGGDLRLDNNQLTSLPESMGSIQVGGDLRLDNNQLASLPASMGSMQVGGDLHLNNNPLTALPESMWSWTNHNRSRGHLHGNRGVYSSGSHGNQVSSSRERHRWRASLATMPSRALPPSARRRGHHAAT